MRRSREDISVPSLIPKLLSSRGKDERLKRQDSKDDIRHSLKSTRKDPKEEVRSSPFFALLTPTGKDEAGKSGIRIFRRDNSREDVGRESANLIKESAKGKQERTETVGGSTKSKVTGEQNKIKCEDCKEGDNDAEESSRIVETIVSIEQDDIIPKENEKFDVESQNARMIDVIVVGNRTQDERTREQNTMVVGEEMMIDEKHLLAIDEPVESVAENDKEQYNIEEGIAERLLDVSSDGDIGVVTEKKGLLEFGYEKRADEFQVVSEILSFIFIIYLLLNISNHDSQTYFCFMKLTCFSR